MRYLNSRKSNVVTLLLPLIAAVVALFFAPLAQAATPGIEGTTFNLVASANLITQPDGQQIYSWGYGCTTAVPGVPFGDTGPCALMQIPGPTLIVTEGQAITVSLTNNLPFGAGNTSILFPGVQATALCTVATDCQLGLLTTEVVRGGTITYTIPATAMTPGTHSYYSGTQSDLQIEMGLYGAFIVLPKTPAVPTVTNSCIALNAESGPDYRLAVSAYDTNPETCYDREYLFQFAEMDSRIHQQAQDQIATIAACTAALCPALSVATEPYHPNYFLINGRSMPDDMDANFAPPYPHQPYNGNPHMHPGDLVLVRVIGQGRWQHPFHEHGNHLRILGRDGNLLTSQTDSTKLAGPLLFTTTTTPGVAFEGIFYWTGRGLNWDVYDHTVGDGSVCTPDVNGYYTKNSVPPAPLSAKNYYEWCADHNKPLETVNGGPATTPDPLILTNGLFFGGSPYLGPDATTKSAGATPLPPGTGSQNPNAGFAFMWHSHNEREITTNDVFPGGAMMMMIVDAPYISIDETL